MKKKKRTQRNAIVQKQAPQQDTQKPRQLESWLKAAAELSGQKESSDLKRMPYFDFLQQVHVTCYTHEQAKYTTLYPQAHTVPFQES